MNVQTILDCHGDFDRCEPHNRTRTLLRHKQAVTAAIIAGTIQPSDARYFRYPIVKRALAYRRSRVELRRMLWGILRSADHA